MSKQKIVKLYLFGDSICFGQLVSSHKTWATVLATALEKLHIPGKQFLVQNAGVNGNTTRQGLERMYYDVTSHSPDYVLIQFGMNDCNYWETDRGMPRVSPAAFIANLQEIVNRCLCIGVKHCFINTNHLSMKGAFRHIDYQTYDQSNHEYNKLIREVVNSMAREMRISMFDIEEVWVRHLRDNPLVNLQDLLLEDGIHLSDSGHQLYINSLIPRLIEQINEMEQS
jgi:acyl-CoA thioesterase-1